MKIVFMGTPDYATTILQEILNSDIEVSLLITQPDKPVGRKQTLTPPHVKRWLKESRKNIEIYQPSTLKSSDATAKISSYKPDYIVVAAYGKILPKEILDIAPCINLHASLLPKYRGASPIQSAILNGENFTGVTAMLMEEGLDCGDILAFRYVKIEQKRVDELFDELSKAAANITLHVLKNFNQIKPIKQVDADATHCIKIKKDNGLVSFEENASDIYKKYRAYTPWPGIFLKNGLKLKELKLLDDSVKNDKIGIISKINKNSITLTCLKGSLEIAKVQAPSKKEISILDYIRGKRLEIGNTLL